MEGLGLAVQVLRVRGSGFRQGLSHVVEPRAGTHRYTFPLQVSKCRYSSIWD